MNKRELIKSILNEVNMSSLPSMSQMVLAVTQNDNISSQSEGGMLQQYARFIMQPLTKEMFLTTNNQVIFEYIDLKYSDYYFEIWEQYSTIEDAINKNISLKIID